MSSERPAGYRIVVGEFVYESDGEDWTCPSHNHDPVLAFDLLLDRIEELEAVLSDCRYHLFKNKRENEPLYKAIAAALEDIDEQ